MRVPVCMLVFVQIIFFIGNSDCEGPELAPLDGWYNNLLNPDWGAIDTHLLRKSPTDYADGVYHMAGPNRPNAFEISSIAHRGQMGLPTQRGRNALQVYFGQQVVEEIMDAQRPGCPREFENIEVPRGHDLYDPEGKGGIFMPFLRARYNQRTGLSPNNPRQQINEITPYLDGQLMYGPARAWTDAIREFKGGRLLALAATEGGPPLHEPINASFPAVNDIRLPFANPPNPRDLGARNRLKNVNRFWRLGNPRGFENPFLLTIGVLWFRLHNWEAKNIRERMGYSVDNEEHDEEIFNEARKFVTAVHQRIVFYEWLPRWLKTPQNFNDRNSFNESQYYPINETLPNPDPKMPTCPYRGYDPTVHPGITNEFATSAKRWGHTVVTPGLWRRGPRQGNNCNWLSSRVSISNFQGSTHGLRLCNAYWNSQESVTDDMDALVRGMTSTLAEQEDHIMVADLAGDVFGPLEFSRRDLAALNIQRGRDHGLPEYQVVREAFGLPRLQRWDQINTEIPETMAAVERLRQFYVSKGFNSTSPDDVDLFTGGLMETTFDGPGELFRAILVDGFCRLRDGDRFWYENRENKLFTDDEIRRINSFTMWDVLVNVTAVTVDEIPNNDVFVFRNGDPCPQPAQLNISTTVTVAGNTLPIIENCTAFQTYDYFLGSEASFALSFLVLFLCIPATILIMKCLAKRRMNKMRDARKRVVRSDKSSEPNTFLAVEWIGPKDGERNVKVQLENQRKKIIVSDRRGKPLRMIDLRSRDKHVVSSVYIWISEKLLSVRAEGEIDLVLRFADENSSVSFTNDLETFCKGLEITLNKVNFKEDLIYSSATTREQRQKLLDKFFRLVCVQAFARTAEEVNLEQLDQKTAKEISNIQLTRTEFADALGLKATSIFVRNMFLMVDSDQSGFVNFREFLDFFVVLSSKDAESKIQLMFNMYDIRTKGVLSKNEFMSMIKSLVDLSDSSLQEDKLHEFVSAMYRAAGVREGSDITFQDFKKIFATEEYSQTLEKATLNLDGLSDVMPTAGNSSSLRARSATLVKRYTRIGRKGKGKDEIAKRRQSKIDVNTKAPEYPKTKLGQKWYEFSSWVATYQLDIYWVILYTLTLFGIFIERAYFYSFEREHAGLRRLAGYGVTVTRGAASAMMFTYSSLLVTMSRNTITYFRETFLHRFFPWDSMIFLHKYIAFWALFFTVVHCVGHGLNLYHISTQASGDLNCYFTEYFRAQHVLASFHYWAWTTITGLTGIGLTIICIVMYVFATPYARRYAFNAFWFTHGWYILLYIGLTLHGAAALVQDPLWGWYFIGPLIIFTIDKLISLSRKNLDIVVRKAEILPSDVTALIFKRPLSFEYKSGQWVRIACQTLGQREFHPFTLTSAPHEENLSLHIRAVGPWTTNLRHAYDPNNIEPGNSLPLLLLDGPYGEGHQDWYRYQVAILVGGGIGVTPFASILKDIVHKSRIADLRFPCKKVYFLWVTRTQKQFEWMTDIIRDVERVDENNFVDVHIFITQFQEKFDLRTTMLYICERHFQKIAGKSLFTGLSATTHFGRPQFRGILESIQSLHPDVQNIGVFSCGPPPLTNGLDRACSEVNKYETGTTFKHHFENF